ncbi:hypothetical protein IMCC3317_05830 [Kordia antarctica]|uniref:Glycosyltransferase RgtA/B/C/D-like domain-containing protein n=1 Tax=Kordia antarctica TaxID=1218801 RepID=A0A7L4ZFF2_9FLAO|nr:hypothetical protein [Kordia antarctica]QHI35237.1 hypothetical protein IMCC3317_05830 [Kordia antarctica]
MNLTQFITNFARLNFLFIGNIFLLLTILFLFGVSLNFYASIFILVAAWFNANRDIGWNKKMILLNVLFLLFGAFLFGTATLYLDLTYDGQSYHQEMSIQMANGWNPVYESFPKENPLYIWVQHYPKAFESIGAVFYSVFHKITYIKAINTLFLILSFLYPFIYFRKTASLQKSILISAIIALNPVVLIQLMTNLIDGFLYTTTIITFFAYLLSKEKKSYRWEVIIGLVLLINIKFTGVIFAGILYGIFLVDGFFIRKEKLQTHIKETFLIAIVAIPFLIAPYFLNFYQNGHPLYPVMGENKIDFIQDYEPEMLKDKKRVSQFVLTNLASIGNKGDSHVKIPFTFTQNELQKNRNGAPRTGSFGVWWSGILILSLLYYGFCVVKIGRNFKLSKYERLIGLIILLILLNKAGWWLRYTPYFWLTPVLLYFSLKRYGAHAKFLKVLFGLIVMNALFTLLISVGLKYKDGNELKNTLQQLAQKQKPIKVDFDNYLGNKVLFKEYGIEFVEANAENFIKPLKINNIVIIENNELNLNE